MEEKIYIWLFFLEYYPIKKVTKEIEKGKDPFILNLKEYLIIMVNIIFVLMAFGATIFNLNNLLIDLANIITIVSEYHLANSH